VLLTGCLGQGQFDDEVGGSRLQLSPATVWLTRAVAAHCTKLPNANVGLKDQVVMIMTSSYFKAQQINCRKTIGYEQYSFSVLNFSLSKYSHLALFSL
jgi:hypothetical protein